MRERPVSVMIFGILNIGFGAFGLLGSFAQSSTVALPSNVSIPSLAAVINMLNSMYKDPHYLLWRSIANPLEVAVNLGLIAAGIGLLKLKNWGRLASLGYAIYSILFLAANIVMLYVVLGTPIQKALESVAPTIKVLLGGALFGALLLSLAYPLLLLFFLTRPKVVSAFRPAPPVPAS